MQTNPQAEAIRRSQKKAHVASLTFYYNLKDINRSHIFQSMAHKCTQKKTEYLRRLVLPLRFTYIQNPRAIKVNTSAPTNYNTSAKKWLNYSLQLFFNTLLFYMCVWFQYLLSGPIFKAVPCFPQKKEFQRFKKKCII